MPLIDVRIGAVGDQRVRSRGHPGGDVGVIVKRDDQRPVAADQVADPLDQRTVGVGLVLGHHRTMQRQQHRIDQPRAPRSPRAAARSIPDRHRPSRVRPAWPPPSRSAPPRTRTSSPPGRTRRPRGGPRPSGRRSPRRSPGRPTRTPRGRSAWRRRCSTRASARQGRFVAWSDPQIYFAKRVNGSSFDGLCIEQERNAPLVRWPGDEADEQAGGQ